jgi:hypothetical protein
MLKAETRGQRSEGGRRKGEEDLRFWIYDLRFGKGEGKAEKLRAEMGKIESGGQRARAEGGKSGEFTIWDLRLGKACSVGRAGMRRPITPMFRAPRRSSKRCWRAGGNLVRAGAGISPRETHRGRFLLPSPKRPRDKNKREHNPEHNHMKTYAAPQVGALALKAETLVVLMSSNQPPGRFSHTHSRDSRSGWF